ncbi:MAG TPA: carboxypeptidase regulatory-like domain-containing protein, partial [Pirellulales bacterium]|nr:carboxypeptidase regulatory-like domain-containing protein [Pirellulales bacterium]
MLLASHASGGFVFRPRLLPLVVLHAAFIAKRIPAAANADEPLPKGTLSGSVVDADDRPVAGARVWSTTWDGKLLMEAFTGADGRFHIGPVEAVYRCRNDLWADAEGFARQYVLRQTYSVFPGADSEIGAIRLDRGCVFTGQILDADGKPMGGAVVECQVYHHELGHTIAPIGPSAKIETDAQGRFRTPPMGIGERSLYVRAPQHHLLVIDPPNDPVGEIALDARRMEPDVPIFGSISDELGRPIAGVRIRASDVDETRSDSDGRFVLSGFEQDPRFQFQASKDGYVFINWGVKGNPEGLRWHEVGGDGTEHGPMRELKVTMHPLAWIEGQAVDEATNEPVRLEKVVLCFFERKPNGEIVLGGCRASDFEQPEKGHFRVPYSQPSDYHLAFSAVGYHDAEAFTPKVATLEAIGGLVVRMRKKAAGSKDSVAHQTISGVVTNH